MYKCCSVYVLWSSEISSLLTITHIHCNINTSISFFLDNSITFLSDVPLCIGETVQMICFIVSPTAEPFNDTAALISFNDSLAATITNINTNTIAGIDTSRYTADITGLTVTTDRPGIRLTITDYQASDGAINFSCHGFYSGGVPSPVLVSGYPQRLAGLLCSV